MAEESADEPGSDLPVRSDYGTGCYRRCIVLESDDGVVRGELSDDFHHFAVTLHHDGRRATRVEGEGVRIPWTTCPGALEPLRRMEGTALSRELPALLRHTPARAQCTHLHDLACLAIAHACRSGEGGATRRRYDAAMPDPAPNGTRAVLERDGEEQLSWQIAASTVVSATPAIFDGLSLGGRSFYRFLRGQPDPELAEAAWILQRAVFIGMGRRHDFENIHAAIRFAPVVGAACHTFDPARVGAARRVYGTLRDFSDAPERILDRDPAPG